MPLFEGLLLASEVCMVAIVANLYQLMCRVGMFGIDLADYPKVKKFSEDFGNNQQVKSAREKMAAASK